MRKRIKIVMSVAVLAALVGLIVWQMAQPREPEPMYNGKRLSDLLKVTWSRDPGGIAFYINDAEVRKAVGQIGTNAIPTLLRWSRTKYSESSLKLGVMNLLLRQRLIKFHLSTGSAWNFAASQGFQALGTNAHAAVPALIEVANGHTAGKRTDAILSLGYIGPPAETAVPTLLHLTSDTNYYVRMVSFVSLGRIHARPEVVVPMLLQGLQDTNQRVQLCASVAFADYGPNAMSAVPQLVQSLRATPAATNDLPFVQALGFIGPAAKESIPFLLPLTTNADAQIYSGSRRAIQRIDPEAAAKAGITNAP
jgi:hypothetical protein